MIKEIRSTWLRYGLALGLFVITIGIALIVSYFSPKNNNLTILVVAVLVAAAWFGGRGPGLLLAALIMLTTIIFSTSTPDDIPLFKLILNHASVFFLLALLVWLISGRRKSENKLRQQTELLEVTLSSIGDGVIATDVDGNITFLNPTAENLTGWKRNEALGKPLGEVFRIIDQETHKPVEDAFLQIKNDGVAEGLANHTTLTGKNGEEIPIDDSSAPIRDHEGNIIGAIVVFHDVTERKQAEQALLKSEERLRQSQKMEAIGTLTGGVAHDFNNLLTAILGNAQLAMRKIKPDEPAQGSLMEIEKACDRAALLTRQLLAFSRRQHLDRRNIDLNDTLSDILKMIERIIGEDVKVVTEYAASLDPVFADRAQLEQVIMNLSANARDAMPQGGVLTIKTSNIELDEYYCRQYPDVSPGKYVQISVCDTGSGMSDETLERIFEPFFTTKEVNKGTGLGLSMAYGIIKQHDGHINVYSELERGTTFKIFLPSTDKNVEKIDRALQPSLLGGSETLLVAEDEEALRNLSKDVLETLGYTVLMAKNGLEAIELFNDNKASINLLVFDVVMPGMGGAEAYDNIRGTSGNIPIIFMTGYGSDAVYNRFGEKSQKILAVPVKVVQKPYSLDTLGRAVREALDGGGS